MSALHSCSAEVAGTRLRLTSAASTCVGGVPSKHPVLDCSKTQSHSMIHGHTLRHSHTWRHAAHEDILSQSTTHGHTVYSVTEFIRNKNLAPDYLSWFFKHKIMTESFLKIWLLCTLWEIPFCKRPCATNLQSARLSLVASSDCRLTIARWICQSYSTTVKFSEITFFAIIITSVKFQQKLFRAKLLFLQYSMITSTIQYGDRNCGSVFKNIRAWEQQEWK